jgi:hypothetical protein
VPQLPPPAPRAALRRIGLLLAAIAVVAACSSPTPSIRLELDDASVAALRGASVQVAVELTRLGGADAPVALGVSGLPASVTAAFSPALLSGAATTSTLTLTVGAGAAEGSADLTVTGTAGTLTTEAELTLDIDSLTVTGRVEGALRRPVIGATIASQGETAFTDASGAFTLTGLALPYDLVVSAGIDDGVLHVYEGLTSPTPLVRPTFAAFATPSTAFDATVDGLFTGGALGANEVVVVCVEGLAVAVYGCTTRDAPDTDYSLSAFWFDGATASVRLHALHMEVDAEGVPTAYLGYETIELNLADGAVVLADLDFDPVASDNLTGTTSHPVALPDSNMLVLARFGPNLSVPLAELSDPADSFSVLVPVLPGLSYDVLFGAGTSGSSTLGWKRDVGLDAGAFTATVPAAALAPADGATGVELGTPFSSTSDGGARTYVWAPDGAGPFIALTTTRTSVTIPNPVLGGFAFPAGAAYSWDLVGHGDDGVDIAVSGGYVDFSSLLYTVLGAGGPGLDGDRSLSVPNNERDFTFAP